MREPPAPSAHFIAVLRPIMRQSENTTILRCQRGQASVFVLAMLGVVLLVTVFLYHSGRLTSEKMQIQNGADAAAFGASVLEARSLNFAAYTNRAMVANEVAIGQLVGLLSFADELKTSRKYAAVYAAILEGIAAAFPPAAGILIPIAEGITTIGNVLGSAGDTLGGLFNKIMPPFIKVLSVINKVYSTSQKIYHGVTYALIFENIDKSLQNNIVIPEGGRGPVLSPFGFVAMLGHIPSSWSGLTRIHSAEDDDKQKGIQRLAATVRAARDPFSSGEDSPLNRDWRFNLVRNFRIVKFTYGADSAGGSELRATDKTYAWTAADGLVFGAKLKLSFKICIPYTDICESVDDSWGWNLPFGTGGYQAVVSKDRKLPAGDILPSTPEKNYGHRSPPVYGGAMDGDHLSAWPGVVAEMSANTIDRYSGLNSYRDRGSEDYRPLLPMSAPSFLVGVVKPLKDLKKQGPQFSGHYDLKGPVADEVADSVGAIAKSELYFAKPTSKGREKPNAFSPYWQARLVETSNSERFFALAVQQDTLWLTQSETKIIGGSILSELRNITRELESFVKDIQDAVDWLWK